MIYSKIWKFFNTILHRINSDSPDFGTVLKITFDEKSFMFHGENHREIEKANLMNFSFGHTL
jgi:hypothetical protein